MVLLAKNSISLFRSQFGALAPAFREAMNRGVNDIPRYEVPNLEVYLHLPIITEAA